MAQRALRGPVLLLLLASLLLCTGSSAVPSPLRWGHAAVGAGWAAVLLGAPALLLGPERETIAAGGAPRPLVHPAPPGTPPRRACRRSVQLGPKGVA